jgi:biopolymer transport protein ExbD
MPRRTRNRDAGVLSPNLTPLLDVVLQLITFFMMLIHFGTKLEGATKAVRLPLAPAALPGADLSLDRLVVSIDARGRLLVDGKALEGKAAESWWSEQAEKRRSGQETLGGSTEELSTVVILRADRAASYGNVRRILVSAQKRGFAHFSLVVLRGRAPGA